MRTRSRFHCAALENICTQKNDGILKRDRSDVFAGEQKGGRKRRKLSPILFGGVDFFDDLPDDLALLILSKLSSSASCAADLINVLITCKKLNTLGLNPVVLSNANRKVFAFKAEKWSESAHYFLKLSADAGNIEAFYILGMIRFYCLQNRKSGASLMAKAAINSHAPALYSLSVIQFNGSGGLKNDKDLRAGVALCARAAFLGHIDAIRELGHCFQDGYGVKQNVVEGRRFLLHANVLELAAVVAAYPSSVISAPHDHHHYVTATCPLTVFGRNLPDLEAHPVHRFLTDWFAGKGSNIIGSDLRLCGNSGCGRPETRRHEFRRCSVCGAVNYCSRSCQSFDWKVRHKVECTPTERWVEEMGEMEGIGNGDGEAGGGIGNGDYAVILES